MQSYKKNPQYANVWRFFFNMIIRIYGKGGLNVEEVGGLKAQ